MKTVIELAKEAGIPCFAGMYVVTEPEELERFVELVRAETKEECARKVEQFRTKMDAGIEHIAEAIRSLS